jgi:hypothetical protein
MTDTPPLAYHDPKFIDSDEGRPVRIVSEYLAPLRAFSTCGVTSTVVFFGSARLRAGGPLGRYVDEAVECDAPRRATRGLLGRRTWHHGGGQQGRHPCRWPHRRA